MHLLDIANAIQLKIAQLDKLKKDMPTAIDDCCKASANYDKQVAITIVRLRNGAELNAGDGHLIKDPPASAIERIAKGICWQERLAMDTAEAKLKALYSNIQITQAQLNGYQSINRHLSEN